MESKKKWYAVYTRPRWEKKVAELLVKKKIESFCPLNRMERQWADRKKVVYEPLFTSYVFVYATEQEHLAIKQTDGIVNFVYWIGKPAVIRDIEIEAIRNFLYDHHNVVLEKTRVNINDEVTITNGPLMARGGIVVEVRTKSIRVLLPSLGYALIAEVNKQHVKVVNPSPNYHYVTNN